MTRELSPLKQAEDAILLDSSHMTLREVVDEIGRIIDTALSPADAGGRP